MGFAVRFHGKGLSGGEGGKDTLAYVAMQHALGPHGYIIELT